MLAQETMTRPGSDRQGSDLPLKQSWKDELSRSISRTHRIPCGHIASLDVARLIASFFIVLGHAGPFDKTVDYHGNIFLKLLLLVFFHVRRMGLPFFLLASGFLFGRSLEKGLPLTPRYVKALKRLTRIFLIWTVFYAFEPFGNPQLRENFLTFDMLKAYYWQIHYLAEQPLLLIIGGTKYNLWFIPSLITSLSILTLFISLKKTRYLPWMAVTMYILSQCLHQEPLKSVVETSKYYEHLRSYCMGFAYVAGGWWFSQQTKFSMKTALKLFTVALVFQITQDLALWHFYHLKPYSFMSIGLLPAIFGIFVMIMCYPDFGKNTVLHHAGSMTLGIYVLHPLILDILRILDRKVLSLSTPAQNLAFPVIMAVTSLILTKIFLKNNLLKKLIS